VGAGLLAANWEPETKTICADVPMIENVKKVAGVLTALTEIWKLCRRVTWPNDVSTRRSRSGDFRPSRDSKCTSCSSNVGMMRVDASGCESSGR